MLVFERLMLLNREKHLKRHFSLFIIMLLGFIPFQLKAQQLIQFSHSQRSMPYFNPALLATGNQAEILAIYRNQWLGLAGNPVTQSLSAAYPVYAFDGGVGINLSKDAIGPQQDVNASVGINRKFHFKRKKLIVGISAGYLQKTLHGDQLITPGGKYEQGIIDHRDVILPAIKQSAGSFDLGFGVALITEKITISLAAQHLYAGKMSFAGENKAFEIQAPPQLIGSLAYKGKINQNWSFTPFFSVKSDLNSNQTDAGIEIGYHDFASFGLAWRGYNKYTNDAVIAMLGLNATPGIFLGYSYDFTVSQLNTVSSGTHEIILNYKIPVLAPSKGKIINNPRFLAF